MSKDWIEVTESRIPIEQVYARLSESENGGFGAHLVFCGVVRNHNHHHSYKKVIAVSYDVFRPLALATFEKISYEIREKLKIPVSVIIIHRIGKLEVGEASVVIGVATAHREECYVASRFLIESLKKQAPIWKKEHYEDGETDWLEGHALCGH
jgi:molybdopterin synthase catalytic subunit